MSESLAPDVLISRSSSALVDVSVLMPCNPPPLAVALSVALLAGAAAALPVMMVLSSSFVRLFVHLAEPELPSLKCSRFMRCTPLHCPAG
jgi:hypothetical protein